MNSESTPFTAGQGFEYQRQSTCGEFTVLANGLKAVNVAEGQLDKTGPPLPSYGIVLNISYKASKGGKKEYELVVAQRYRSFDGTSPLNVEGVPGNWQIVPKGPKFTPGQYPTGSGLWTGIPGIGTGDASGLVMSKLISNTSGSSVLAPLTKVEVKYQWQCLIGVKSVAPGSGWYDTMALTFTLDNGKITGAFQGLVPGLKIQAIKTGTTTTGLSTPMMPSGGTGSTSTIPLLLDKAEK